MQLIARSPLEKEYLLIRAVEIIVPSNPPFLLR
jgi:hypothetical protein